MKARHDRESSYVHDESQVVILPRVSTKGDLIENQESCVVLSTQLSPSRSSSARLLEDVAVKRHKCCACSTAFWNTTKGEYDDEMNRVFATTKYKNFEGTVVSGSALFSLVLLAISVQGLLDESQIARVVLNIVSSLMYFAYAIYAKKFRTLYLESASSNRGIVLTAMLCLHGLVNCMAEFFPREARLWNCRVPYRLHSDIYAN